MFPFSTPMGALISIIITGVILGIVASVRGKEKTVGAWVGNVLAGIFVWALVMGLFVWLRP